MESNDMDPKREPLWSLLGLLYRAHPWHGVSPGDSFPDVVNCYVEVVPSETFKYEIDKVSGILCVDRPQKFSNVCPHPYGFVPKTYCADSTAQYCMEKTGRNDIDGDMDPLDICVLTEKSLTHGDILLRARPIGGLRMIDDDESDDKIIAVLEGDASYGHIQDISECPNEVIERLKHYFLTYKQGPDSPQVPCEITHTYNREEAHEVLRRSQDDYEVRFKDLEKMLLDVLRETR